jgi:hypothetical protein
MPLSFDGRTVRSQSCSSCGEAFQHVTGYINDEGGAYAVYFAACHGHPEHEAQIDVVLGSWGVEPPVHDFLTFSCRLQSDSAMAADAALATTSDDPILGQRLSRAEALEHPKLQEFWGVVDFLAESDPTVNSSVYGSFPPKPGGGRLGQVRRLFRSGGRAG